MRFYWLPETADANIKGCGMWVHYKTTLFGIAPAWWYRDRSAKRPTRRLGVNILTPAPHYDRFVFAAIEIGRKQFGIYRTELGGRLRLGVPSL
jgi:hypothetical protein